MEQWMQNSEIVRILDGSALNLRFASNATVLKIYLVKCAHFDSF